MDKTRRSVEEETLANIATLIEYCRAIPTSETSTKDVNVDQDCPSQKAPSSQQLIEALYHTCLTLDKDSQYLYALLARAEHKLRWHEDREVKQATERKTIAKLLSNANKTIATLIEATASKRTEWGNL